MVKSQDNFYFNPKFNRACTLIIEKNKIPGTDLSPEFKFVLFRHAKFKTYIEPGGKINRKINKNNKSDILIETARRELAEESLNTYNFSKNIYLQAKYFDHITKKTKYQICRIYLILVSQNGFEKLIYNNNKNILNNKINKKFETNNISKFKISDIKKSTENICPDITGQNQIIYSETMDILKIIIENNLLNGLPEINLKLIQNKLVKSLSDI